MGERIVSQISMKKKKKQIREGDEESIKRKKRAYGEKMREMRRRVRENIK